MWFLRTASSALSLGVKRIRSWNEGENGHAQSANQQPTDDPLDIIDGAGGNDHPDQDNTEAVDTIMECLNDCKPDREGPNQPTSSQILAATKRVQSRQTRYVQAQWFCQHP